MQVASKSTPAGKNARTSEAHVSMVIYHWHAIAFATALQRGTFEMHIHANAKSLIGFEDLCDLLDKSCQLASNAQAAKIKDFMGLPLISIDFQWPLDPTV